MKGFAGRRNTGDPELALDDLELPADFDLSLAEEMDAPDAFAAELDDVNAELESLSGSIGEPTFTEQDALASAEDEPNLDFLSGTDEVATKLDHRPRPTSIWVTTTAPGYPQ